MWAQCAHTSGNWTIPYPLPHSFLHCLATEPCLELCSGGFHPTTIPPPVSMARAMFLLSRGGVHWQGGPCFFFRRGGSIDTRTGGPLTRVLVKISKKIRCVCIF